MSINVKDIQLRTITSARAAGFVKQWHYSGKVVQNSQLHFGAFVDGRLMGVLSYGPSLDKRKVGGLVANTGWNEFIELNRMAFHDDLPKNSESRCIAVSLRLLKKAAPNIKWVVTFADGTQCGDGTIYRACGFKLTAVKQNTQIIEFPDGLRETRLVMTDSRRPRRLELAKRYGVTVGGAASLKPFLEIGAKMIPGFQLRYVYFLDKTKEKDLTVPVLPYSKIAEMGAGMYKGITRDKHKNNASDFQSEKGGAVPTIAHQELS